MQVKVTIWTCTSVTIYHENSPQVIICTITSSHGNPYLSYVSNKQYYIFFHSAKFAAQEYRNNAVIKR